MTSRTYPRFLLAGVFFTLAGPSFFILAAKLMAPVLASILCEISMHTVRCLVYNRIVFTSLGGGVRTYLSAAIPTSLLNIGLVYCLQSHLPSWQIGLLIGLQSSTIGYLWSRACYRYNVSLRLRNSSQHLV
jgi:hypothetical protein